MDERTPDGNRILRGDAARKRASLELTMQRAGHLAQEAGAPEMNVMTVDTDSIKDLTDEELSKTMREKFKAMMEPSLDSFRTVLIARGGSLKQTYPLDSKGFVPFEEQNKYAVVSVEDEESLVRELNQIEEAQVPGLLFCAIPTARATEHMEAFLTKPEDLRVAAEWITERHSDITITITERTNESFSYIARLKKAAEK